MHAALTSTIAAAAVALLAASSGAHAQGTLGVSFAGIAPAAAFNELGNECFDAGMFTEMQNDTIMDCSVVLEERRTSGSRRERDGGDGIDDLVVVRHHVRFTLLGRGNDTRIAADSWTETEEAGTAIEEPIASPEYLARLDEVLTAVSRRLRAAQGAPPPWAGRFESEQAWHLEAHLRAVAYCDKNLASMSADALGRDLMSIGIWPLRADTRDRCEQLYQDLFEWGLARGDDDPTVAEYARYRASLPPAERPCSGRLALAASCPP